MRTWALRFWAGVIEVKVNELNQVAEPNPQAPFPTGEGGARRDSFFPLSLWGRGPGGGVSSRWGFFRAEFILPPLPLGEGARGWGFFEAAFLPGGVSLGRGSFIWKIIPLYLLTLWAEDHILSLERVFSCRRVREPKRLKCDDQVPLFRQRPINC